MTQLAAPPITGRIQAPCGCIGEIIAVIKDCARVKVDIPCPDGHPWKVGRGVIEGWGLGHLTVATDLEPSS